MVMCACGATKGTVIIMKITEIIKGKKPSLSFEVFPPKTDAAYADVAAAAHAISDLTPSYISVTYGAGGSTAGYTFDIAKESVLMAAKSDAERRVKWFVGDLAHLPLQDDSVDCILNIFSPANQAEFTRVLRPGGYIIKVIPANDHLKELRQIAQAHLKKAEYSNAEVLEHFEQQYSVMYKKNAAATIAMPQEDIRTFADMTPLLFHVDVDKLALDELTKLTIAAEVLVAKI